MMRPLFLCLSVTLLLPPTAIGQDCAASTCPACPGGASPVCTDSGNWVCPCTTSGDATCYTASDCGGEGYSCVDGCCVYSAGCSQGACLSASDCGTDVNLWSCYDGCCEPTGNEGCGPLYNYEYESSGGCPCALDSDCQSSACEFGQCFDPVGGGGDEGGACVEDSDCDGCQACSADTCVDDDGYCEEDEYCKDGECIYQEEGVGKLTRVRPSQSSDRAGPRRGRADTDGLPNPSLAEDPIAVDLGGGTFAMTDLAGGVKFDYFGIGRRQQTSWTSAASKVGWLVLDVNRNSRIDNGFEMFSNIAKQPGLGPNSIGFKALAQYDLPANGGNGDGVIDQRDSVFSRLRLWVDSNHDGVSQPAELLTMQQAGIQSISLYYEMASWTDAYGNTFRNRAAVLRSPGTEAGTGQWAYDVVLLKSR